MLAASYGPVPDGWSVRALRPEVAVVAAGSFKHRHPPQIRGTGCVVQSLEAALGAFHHPDNFRDGCLRAVNLGDDADTTGACYGEAGLPEPWRPRLALRDAIATLALRDRHRRSAAVLDRSRVERRVTRNDSGTAVRADVAATGDGRTPGAAWRSADVPAAAGWSAG